MARNLLISGQLHLYGDVGNPYEDEPGFTDLDVAQALAELGPGNVTVRMNTGGGIAVQGMAIYSQLKAHPGNVDISIDGVAASAGSLIAMAGDRIAMRAGTMMMIHDPSGITIGPAKAHVDTAANLNKLADSYAVVYAARSGKTPEQARAIMLATTWLNADEAVAQGFATEKVDAAATAMAAFDYTLYRNVPGAVLPFSRPAAPRANSAAALARMRMRQAQL